MKRQQILKISVCVVFLIAIVFPAVSAVPENPNPLNTQQYLDQERPEIIAALRTHAAYVGEEQQARMNGVIGYIDRISGGTGTSGLQWIREDYMTAASSIPLMQSADEINDGREEMRRQSVLFSDEAQTQMAIFNGSIEGMRASINTSLHPVEVSFMDLNTPLLLAHSGARLAVFNNNSEERDALLAGISRKGVDVTEARRISDQIDARRSELQNVLARNSKGAISALNSGLSELNRQFRSTVQQYRTDLKTQADVAAMMAMQ